MQTIRAAGRYWFAAGLLAIVLGIGTAAWAGEATITLWSHEADEAAKVAWAETAVRNFEKKNPGVKVKITWYQWWGTLVLKQPGDPSG